MNTATGTPGPGRRRRDRIGDETARQTERVTSESARMTELERSGQESEREAIPASPVTHADIAERAYQIYLARGGENGYDVEDWLAAERELSGQQVKLN